VTVATGGEKDGALITLLVRSNIKTYYLHHLQRSLSPLQDFLAFFDLLKLIKKVRPDIIHLNSSKASSLGALAARLCGVKKIIYTVHGLILNEPLSPLQRLFYWLSEWFSAKLKNKLICVSEFDRQSLQKNKITTDQKISVIHNGLDLGQMFFLDQGTARTKLSAITQKNIQNSDFVIGTIANLYPTKGLTYLIEAGREVLNIYPKTKFIIIGKGPLQVVLQKLITDYRLDGQVILAGGIPEASQYLRAFDLFVLTSLKEGLAYALLEAEAAGLPIVATSVGGNPEVVADNFNGLLVPPADFSALAQAIINLIPDKAHLASYAQNSQEKIKDFSLAQMCEKTLTLYLE
jgi:glycosyltransferase involved in cell wall biosynthesis